MSGRSRGGAVEVAGTGLFWVAGLGGPGATGSAAVGQRAAALVLERVG